jgi:hypothetical protein
MLITGRRALQHKRANAFSILLAFLPDLTRMACIGRPVSHHRLLLRDQLPLPKPTEPKGVPANSEERTPQDQVDKTSGHVRLVLLPLPLLNQFHRLAYAILFCTSWSAV